ncbi:MAG TPA: FecR domain-containing protein [Gemmatimonadaceae bacterium]
MTHTGADWDRLGRYVSGELPPAEAGEVERWLADHASDAQALAALDAATRKVAATRPVDVERALRRVKVRLAPRTPWRQYATWAAAAAVVLVAGTMWRRNASEVSPPVPAREFATNVGARDSVVLGDGSRVILGPATRIRVSGREVDLATGEALFSVVHDATRPFTVRAGGTLIRDIGTEFSVHSDRDGEVRVVVREGSVRMTRNADSVVLVKGDIGMLASGGQVRASRGAATSDDLAWTTGRLVFRNAPISELGADLRRWYGVELRVTDSAILKRHFTGSFANESPARVLDVIALALGARVDRRGDTVFIRPAASSK